MGIPRFWLYKDYEWDKGKFFDKGDDEFTRLTVVVRLPFDRAIVIPYKYCDCGDCDVRREEDCGWRISLLDDDYAEISELADYNIKVHRYSRNRLPLNEYMNWTPNELERYLHYGLIPFE